jgi:transposase-like protein
MNQQRYSEGFRRQAVQKMYSRGAKSISELARELGCSAPSLYNWSNEMKLTTAESQPSTEWTADERFQFVFDFERTPVPERGLWLRSKGLTSEMLDEWKQSMLEALTPALTAIRVAKLQKKIGGLEHLLERKEQKLQQKELIISVQKKVMEIFEVNREESHHPKTDNRFAIK